MNVLFLILCLVFQSAVFSEDTPDTLWAVDFSSLTSIRWIAGPFWEYTDESIFLDLAYGGSSGSLEDILISPEFVVPVFADSLVLIFDHYWWGHGSAHHVSDWARSTSTLDMYSSGNPPYPIELWKILDWCGSPNGPLLYTGYTYDLKNSGPICIPLTGVSAGDTLTFTFRGLVESYWGGGGVYAIAYIEWDLYTFMILNYPSVNLEQSTWGMIKASF